MSAIERAVALVVLSSASCFLLSILLGALGAIAWIGAQIGFNGVAWLVK